MPMASLGTGFASGTGPRERIGAAALTLLAYALILALLLLFRAGPPSRPRPEDRLTTILPTPPKPRPLTKPEFPPSPKPAPVVGAPGQQKPAPAPPLLPDQPAPAIITPIVELPTVALTEPDPSSAPGHSDQAPGSGNGQAGGGLGRTPGSGGAPLLPAQWYREPTGEELRRFLPTGAPGKGWGLIACRTIAGNRVTDCEILNEFPRGSGYAKAARDAAFQYRVKAPRVGGKAQLGAWVSIRINY